MNVSSYRAAVLWICRGTFAGLAVSLFVFYLRLKLVFPDSWCRLVRRMAEEPSFFGVLGSFARFGTSEIDELVQDTQDRCIVLSYCLIRWLTVAGVVSAVVWAMLGLVARSSP